MITCELRRLLKNEVVPVPISKQIEDSFNAWLKKREDKTGISKLQPLEIFYAGYILANPILREQYF